MEFSLRFTRALPQAFGADLHLAARDLHARLDKAYRNSDELPLQHAVVELLDVP